MSLQAISLSWFRGAADLAELEAKGKSVVVYGANGSGKSSFVDAIEYLLRDGKVGHLSHEYSGRRQEKGLPNTHTPEGKTCSIRVALQNGAKLGVDIQSDGHASAAEGSESSYSSWDYRRTVLRQHEVSDFIRGTKLEKYSALLPLLGLQSLELVADNLASLQTALSEEAQLPVERSKLKQLAARRSETFGTKSDQEITENIARLHATYCSGCEPSADPTTRCKELASTIQTRIDTASDELRRHLALQALGSVRLTPHIATVRETNARFAQEAEPFVREQVGVLAAAKAYAEQLDSTGQASCPACGRSIEVGSFRAHVEAEHARLEVVIRTAEERDRAVNSLAQALTILKHSLGKGELDAWKDSLQPKLHEFVAAATAFDVEALRTDCTEGRLSTVEQQCAPIVRAADAASKNAPPEAAQLTTDKSSAEVAKAILVAAETRAAVERAETIVTFLRALENGVRAEILARTKRVINDITGDVQVMWSILHPDDPIENVHLYVPRDGDRAIEIGLRFHGQEQDSPRLTLSEGYRNALGLCIFLAMAKREAVTDSPVLLDDVVVSLDRNHRGMVVDLLNKEFSGRQVLIFTHDRDWYAELHQQLGGSRWMFKVLLPWEDPETGIRWSHNTSTFADARAHLHDRPDSAGNDARKIMDVELSLLADRLQVRMPYLRGDRNDKRTAHDFLVRMIAAAGKCFQIRQANDWEVNESSIPILQEADRLLVSWGNRASHSRDLVRSEATKLIDACEAALEQFFCPECEKPVGYAEASRQKLVQCGCSRIRWRYGRSGGK